MTNHQRIALQPVSDVGAIDSDFFSGYSAFKHGGLHAVEGYASTLAGFLMSAWVARHGFAIAGASTAITSPPFAAIPSASHYLAESVVSKLQPATKGCMPFRYLPLRKRAAGAWHDYSNLAPAQRATSQVEQASLFLEPPPELRRRHIVVINDLRVTGHQERILSGYLTQHLAPEWITWVYLGEVQPQLANNTADVENRLNNAQLPTAASYVRFLSENPWSPTARGVRRLLCLPISQVRKVLGSMAIDNVAQLAKLAQAEHLCPAPDILSLTEPTSSKI